MKAILMARVSSVEQQDNSSLAAQMNRLEKYAYNKSLEVLSKHKIVESSVKGKREKFKSAVDIIFSHKECIAIVADSIDRLQRDFKETILFNQLIEQKKIELHFLREGLIINHESTGGEIMMWDAMVLSAKIFIMNLKENSKRGRIFQAQKGIYCGTLPMGYRKKYDTSGKRVVLVDHRKAKLLNILFQKYATGEYSTSDLARLSVEIGLYKKKKNDPYLNSIRKLILDKLKNTFYIGEIKIGKKIYNHSHPTFISRELFEKCQKIIRIRAESPRFTTIDYENYTLINRLCVCGDCGNLVVHKSSLGYAAGKRQYYQHYYQCVKRKAGASYCSEKSIRHDTTELQIIAALDKLNISPDILDKIELSLPELLYRQPKTFNAFYCDTKDQIQKLETDLINLTKAYLEGVIDQHQYKVLSNENKILKNEKTNQKLNFLNLYQNLRKKINGILDFSSSASSVFQTLPNSDKRKIVYMVFKKLTLKDGIIEFEYRKPLNLIVERHSHQKWGPIIKTMAKDYISEIMNFETNIEKINKYEMFYKKTESNSVR